LLVDRFTSSACASGVVFCVQERSPAASTDCCQRSHDKATAGKASGATTSMEAGAGVSMSALSSALLMLSPPRAPYVHCATPLLLHTPPPLPAITANFWYLPGSSLAAILQHSNHAIASDLDRRLVLLQLCLCLAQLHTLDLPHGRVTPANVYLSHGALLSLHSCQLAAEPSRQAPSLQGRGAEALGRASAVCRLQPLHALTQRWRCRKLSTFDYLMQLNRMSGRCWEDLDCLPMLPWVLDFSCDPRPGLAHRCVCPAYALLISMRSTYGWSVMDRRLLRAIPDIGPSTIRA
jgi:hypothetical protein